MASGRGFLAMAHRSGSHGSPVGPTSNNALNTGRTRVRELLRGPIVDADPSISFVSLTLEFGPLHREGLRLESSRIRELAVQEKLRFNAPFPVGAQLAFEPRPVTWA